MTLSPELLAVLACPEDKGPLLYFGDDRGLYNPRLQRRYLITDGIPIMLIDEAEAVSDEEHAGASGQSRIRRHQPDLRGLTPDLCQASPLGLDAGETGSGSWEGCQGEYASFSGLRPKVGHLVQMS